MNRRFFVTGTAAATTLGSNALGPVVAGAEVLRPSISFHSNFWVNLHHRLYRQAVATLAVRTGERLRGTAPQAYADLARLSPRDRTAWNVALATYERDYAARDLLFDNDLPTYYERLTRAENRADATLDQTLPTKLLAALHRAAPVYARTSWSGDDASNLRWIASAWPAFERARVSHGTGLSRIFQTPWRTVPYRDDIVRYGNWAEAYTLDERECVYGTIGSASPGNAGRASLETIFHEASHSLVFPDDGTVGLAIRDAARRMRREPPEQLWHAVIFYTAGELTKDFYDASGRPGYVPFADAAGLWHGDWARYRTALEAHWRPYLSGSGTLRSALSRCVRAILA